MNLPQWLLAGAALMLAACSSHDEEIAAPAALASNQGSPVWQNNGSPAEASCALMGGRMGFSRQLNGSNIGTCLLANGKRCDENALASGSCPAG